jgi:hypothetical protein
MPRRAHSYFLLVSALACLATSATGCRSDRTTIEDRLWISGVPDGPRAEFSAFFVTGSEGRYLGVVHRGSMYEGKHRVFSWSRDDKNVTIEYLQDGQRRRSKVLRCDAPKGFDVCIRFDGGGHGGIERWYSRKRWAVPRRKKSDLTGADWFDVVAAIAEDDPALQPLFSAE